MLRILESLRSFTPPQALTRALLIVIAHTLGCAEISPRVNDVVANSSDVMAGIDVRREPSTRLFDFLRGSWRILCEESDPQPGTKECARSSFSFQNGGGFLSERVMTKVGSARATRYYGYDSVTKLYAKSDLIPHANIFF